MFSVQHKYRSQLGAIRVSQAAAGSHLRNKTQGVALKYVCQGAEHYQVGDESICVDAGQLLILREDRKFEANTDQRRVKAKGICIDLDTDFVLAEIPDLYEYELLFGLPITGQGFLTLLQSFNRFAQGRSQPEQHEEDMKALRQQLTTLVQLISKVQPKLSQRAKKASTQKHLLTKLLKAKDFIYRHYHTAITLNVLARQVGISTYHFSRLFQLCFNQSPQQLQQQLRMEAALRMLSDEQLTLGQIAYALGYYDQASFSKQFKQYYQDNPSGFRKRLT